MVTNVSKITLACESQTVLTMQAISLKIPALQFTGESTVYQANLMKIGTTIRGYRLSKGLSQGDIEKRTGLLRCYLSRVENGHTVPSLDTLAKIAVDNSLAGLKLQGRSHGWWQDQEILGWFRPIHARPSGSVFPSTGMIILLTSDSAPAQRHRPKGTVLS